MLAALLAAGATVLVLRPTSAQPPSSAASSPPADTAQLAGIPLVLPVADPATTSVLRPGDAVDLYVAHGEDPPVLLVTGVPLLDIQKPEAGHSGSTIDSRASTHIVVQIPLGTADMVQHLLSATWIVATISAVNSA